MTDRGGAAPLLPYTPAGVTGIVKKNEHTRFRIGQSEPYHCPTGSRASEYQLQACQLRDSLGRRSWPVGTPLARKAFQQPRRPAMHGSLLAENQSLQLKDLEEEEEEDNKGKHCKYNVNQHKNFFS